MKTTFNWRQVVVSTVSLAVLSMASSAFAGPLVKSNAQTSVEAGKAGITQPAPKVSGPTLTRGKTLEGVGVGLTAYAQEKKVEPKDSVALESSADNAGGEVMRIEADKRTAAKFTAKAIKRAGLMPSGT